MMTEARMAIACFGICETVAEGLLSAQAPGHGGGYEGNTDKQSKNGCHYPYSVVEKMEMKGKTVRHNIATIEEAQIGQTISPSEFSFDGLGYDPAGDLIDNKKC
jgi:hypothetical protein